MTVLAEERRPDNPFLNLLWLVHAYGTNEAADSSHDVRTKADIVAALRTGKSLSRSTSESFMAPQTFARLAGDDGQLDDAEVQKHLERQISPLRRAMLPKVVSHLQLLSTGFDQISETQRERSKELVEWIVENYKPGQALPIVFVCTGNSRRSMLGAAMGNAAASYYGLGEIRCYSGGTKPSAFNERTIATLRQVGFEITATVQQAELGSESANPFYKVRWGEPVEGQSQESLEFSKRYNHTENPRKGFAAIMVCSEADLSCPSVTGAAVRISMPYIDPKLYDDTEFEAQKYAERRDDIGRALLSVMMQARLRLASSGRL